MKVFITYSWDSESHKEQVLSFVDFLRKNGFDATLDMKITQEESSPNFNQMMHKGITDSHKVIIVLSNGYKDKADSFKGGVGTEYGYIISDIKVNPKKYILVSFDDISKTMFPLAFEGRQTIDLKNRIDLDKLFAKLKDEEQYKFSPVAVEMPKTNSKLIPDFESLMKRNSRSKSKSKAPNKKQTSTLDRKKRNSTSRGAIKLIVTADDYGVHKNVNEGIIDGILNGAINTVTVLMNFKKSVEDLESLIEILAKNKLLKKVGLGIHLNITTGEPVLHENEVKSLTKGKYFKTMTQLNRDGIQGLKVAEIIKELQAQIDLFKEAVANSGEKVFIDHFTSQHNVLHSVRRFARVVGELAIYNKDLGKHPTKPIPCRRPIPAMMEYKEQDIVSDELQEISKRTKAYVVWNRLGLGSVFYKLKYLGRPKLIEVTDDMFVRKNIQVPDAMYFSFFGSKPGTQAKLVDFKNILPLLHQAAIDEGTIEPDGDFFIEVVHHIGIAPSANQLKAAKKISGFDSKYFEKFRKNELEIVKDPYYESIGIGGLNNPIEFANYSDMNE